MIWWLSAAGLKPSNSQQAQPFAGSKPRDEDLSNLWRKHFIFDSASCRSKGWPSFTASLRWTWRLLRSTSEMATPKYPASWRSVRKDSPGVFLVLTRSEGWLFQQFLEIRRWFTYPLTILNGNTRLVDRSKGHETHGRFQAFGVNNWTKQISEATEFQRPHAFWGPLL